MADPTVVLKGQNMKLIVALLTSLTKNIKISNSNWARTRNLNTRMFLGKLGKVECTNTWDTATMNRGKQRQDRVAGNYRHKEGGEVNKTQDTELQLPK